MIILDLKADNFFLFNNFHINFSYPKKIVNSGIEDEFLSDRPNFRYKKLVILMGANATGKTTLGKLMMGILNFLDRKEYNVITTMIHDISREASFSIDMVLYPRTLYRISADIAPKQGESYNSSDVRVSVKNIAIGKTDSYESCAKKLDAQPTVWTDNYVQLFDDLPALSWMFEYSITTEGATKSYSPVDKERYRKLLEKTLKMLDPHIVEVTNPESGDYYFVKYDHSSVIIKDGSVMKETDILSSGTKEGLGVARIIAGIKAGAYHFFFCDEKFSHIHTDAEKAFISLMTECLAPDDQMFITTHNTDILDMNFPKHSYSFFKRESDNSVSCVCAADLLKRNTDSLKNAVENDLFLASPDVTSVYDLLSM